MLLAVLLLQAPDLLPPRPPLPGPTPAGTAALRALEAACADGLLEEAERRAWQPAPAAREEALRRALEEGDAYLRRAATVLAAGCPGDGALARSLWGLALRARDPAEALGALLAPAEVPDAVLPALAAVALDPRVSLDLRAAAAGRLLEAGVDGAWPLARSVLRTGTGLDEDAPWADWERTGRYELPKRLLLRSVRTWLGQAGLEMPGVEPNAAWPVLEKQLLRLEEAARRRRGALPPPAPGAAARRALRLLLEAARQGDGRAREALALLHPFSGELLRQALASGDPLLGAAVQDILDRIPQ